MKQKKGYKKRTIKLTVAVGVLTVILVVLFLLKSNTEVCEFMSANFCRTYIRIAGTISGLFPFSLYEAFLYVAIIGLLILVTVAFVFLFKKQRMRALTYFLVIAIIGVGFGDWYTLTAGFAYSRDEVELPYYSEEASKEEILEYASLMVDELNRLSSEIERDEKGRVISPYSTKELAQLMKTEYKRLNGYFSEYTPTCKTITSKNIMTEMHLCGVFFAPFGEANVNPLTPAVSMPTTMAHELAHSKGVMREDDANLVAFYLCMTSDDAYLRYCGYYKCYARLLSAVFFYDVGEYNQLVEKIDRAVFAESRAENAFWSSKDTLSKITNTINDAYLKMQGQDKGTDSYVHQDDIKDDVIVNDDGQMQIVKKYNLTMTQRMIMQVIDRLKNTTE